VSLFGESERKLQLIHDASIENFKHLTTDFDIEEADIIVDSY
jgi:hypothetical protein